MRSKKQKQPINQGVLIPLNSNIDDYNLKISQKETEGRQFIFLSFLAGLFTYYIVNKISYKKNILK